MREIFTLCCIPTPEYGTPYRVHEQNSLHSSHFGDPGWFWGRVRRQKSIPNLQRQEGLGSSFRGLGFGLRGKSGANHRAYMEHKYT